MQEKITEIRRQTQNSDCNRKFSDLFHEWYQSNKHRIKESTGANYLMKAQKHILPVFGENFVSSVTNSDVNKFIDLNYK